MSKETAKKGFSLSEVLITLGIFGILCSTVLATNNSSNTQCAVAETSLTEMDEAVNSWTKSIMKKNETGTGFVGVIKSQETLVASLENHFNSYASEQSKSDDVIITNDTDNGAEKKYKDFTKIKLRNNMTISAKYTYKPSYIFYNGKLLKSNVYGSQLAVIKINVPVGQSSEYLSATYVIADGKISQNSISTNACKKNS